MKYRLGQTIDFEERSIEKGKIVKGTIIKLVPQLMSYHVKLAVPTMGCNSCFVSSDAIVGLSE